jgi:hypothetical protein
MPRRPKLPSGDVGGRPSPSGTPRILHHQLKQQGGHLDYESPIFSILAAFEVCGFRAKQTDARLVYVPLPHHTAVEVGGGTHTHTRYTSEML